MSEKKQDQLIRETFDQYRTSIESMPSLRAQIVHKISEKPARSNRLYYRLAAVAAALVLLLGVAVPVLSGNGFQSGRPDQVRTTGDLAAVQPEPTGFVPLAQPEEKPAYKERLELCFPELVDQLVPLNLSCEHSGIRFEVLSATVSRQKALFVCAVQDLEGDRVNECTPQSIIGSFSDVLGFDYDGSGAASLGYDAAEHRCVFAASYEVSNISDRNNVTIGLNELAVYQKKSVPLDDLPAEAGSVRLVDIPQLFSLNGHMMEEYWATGLKVMDYSSPSDGTPISSHVRLNHIGLYDGLLHMQFVLDKQPVLVNDRSHTPVADIHMIYTAPADVNPPEWARRLEWDNDGLYGESFVEYILPYDPESGIRANLKELVVQELEEVVHDKWEIKVPLRDVLVEEAGSPAKSAQPEANLNYRTRIDTVDPDLVKSLVPVNLSYEKSGIRLNVLQGAVKENEALLVYSIEDLEGGRINEHTENEMYPVIVGYTGCDTVLAEYDEAGNRCFFGIYIQYQDLASCLDGPVFPLCIPYLNKTEIKDTVIQASPDSSESPALVAMPKQADWYIEPAEGPEPRKRDLKVIDYSSPQDIPLGPHVRLSQAGVVDGQFHVQLHYVDNTPVPVMESGEYQSLVHVDVSLENQPGWNQCIRWDENGDEVTDFEEFVFTLNGKQAGSLEYRVEIAETTEVLADGWKVEVPLQDVWAGTATYTDIVHRIEQESIPLYVKENYPQLGRRLVLIDRGYEFQGIEMRVLYGAVTEQEALFVYSLEDLEGTRITKNLACEPFIKSDPKSTDFQPKMFGKLHYDEPSCRYTGVVRYRYNDLSEISNNGEIEMEIYSLQNLGGKIWHLEDLLRDYDGYAGLTELPVLLEYREKGFHGGKIEYYTNEDYQKLGMKVLESSEELYPLDDKICVSAIGAAEGMIHVQLKYLYESYYHGIKNVQVSCTGTGIGAGLPAMAWDTDNDGILDFEEYVFPCDPEVPDNLRLEVSVIEYESEINGEWKVRMPLELFPSLDT